MSVVDIHKIRGKRPEFDVYIGRSSGKLVRSIWCNPFRGLRYYEKYIKSMIDFDSVKYDLELLRGKRLGCWCITTDSFLNPVCHGQILLKLVFDGYKRLLV